MEKLIVKVEGLKQILIVCNKAFDFERFELEGNVILFLEVDDC